MREEGRLPLELYAALGDGRSVAFVGADGSIDWWCVPNMDSTPLFDRLLDPEDGGRFSVTPEGPFTVERRYRQDSNVLEQTFTTGAGSARVTDSLNSGISGRLPWCELARRIEGLTGSVTFDIHMRPGRKLERANPWREVSPHGDVLHIDGIIAAFRSDDTVEHRVTNDAGIVAWVTTASGSRAVVAILASADEPLILPPITDIDARIDRSDQSWREWTGNLRISGVHADAIKRSALALKLLLYSPTGAIAAAATTSLPERIGGVKNYDYRFAWIRDVCYTIKAFLRVGATEEAKAAFSWLTATVRRHGHEPSVMYRLDGSLVPDLTTVDLPGYARSTPIQIGNSARDQFQLGVYGDILATALSFVEDGHVLDLVTRRLVADLADRCADVWRLKDAGIWELDETEHYTISKIGCWTALNCGVKLAELGQTEASHAARWQRERDRIRDWIDTACWSETKRSYTLFAGSEKLDASLLLGIAFGFDRPDRLAATQDAIARELGDGPLIHRYSGMAGEEGAFTACGFWMAEAYALRGNKPAALRQMNALLDVCGANLGVMTEQIDATGGHMLGNMPQALSHLALIFAAVAIEKM